MDIEAIWHHLIFIYNRKYSKFGNIEIIESKDNYFIVKVWLKTTIQLKIEINWSFTDMDSNIEITDISPQMDKVNLLKILTVEVRSNRLKILNF